MDRDYYARKTIAIIVIQQYRINTLFTFNIYLCRTYAHSL